MNNKKCFKILIISIIFIILIGTPYIIVAGLITSPSIHITLKNINTNNYVIDLFEYDLKPSQDSYPFINTGWIRPIESGGIYENGYTIYYDKIADERRNNCRTG